MCLNFGLYLVEQGILTCDQFCGLVRLQQALLPSPAAIALRKNLMSIQSVAKVYSVIESQGHGNFLAIAKGLRLLGSDQAEAIERLRRIWAPSIESLLVDCQVLTQQQVDHLKARFEGVTGKLPVKDSREISGSAQNPAHERVPAPKFKTRPVIQVQAPT
ncbi:MAG: hypothetical protein KF851_13490 [Pirellulaceae bacterium]|jgi:hypothetical protein|nr:hypothetical protein [Pirellulaceae bacterium]